MVSPCELLAADGDLYRRLVKDAPVGILIVTRDGRIFDLNQRSADILGSPSIDASRAINILEFPPLIATGATKDFRRCIESGESVVGDRPYVSKWGKAVHLRYHLQPLFANGEVCGVQVLFEDIASLKLAEAALRESEKKLQRLSSHLLAAQEHERRRISLELHDELGQALAVLKLRLRAIQTRLEPSQASLREECDESLAYIDQTIENVRRLSRDLCPLILVDLGLTEAIGKLVDELAAHSPYRITATISNTPVDLPVDKRIAVYRIVQEMLTNAQRHADATEIAVAVDTAEGRLLVSVTDNGKGFDPVEGMFTHETGMGLEAMNERARILGGVLEIESGVGMGTKVALALPLAESYSATAE